MPITDIEKERIVEEQARKNAEVIYGARAVNKQVSGPFQRLTRDFDVYSGKPKRSASQLEKSFDNRFGNDFYVKPAKHEGTWKVMSVGEDRKKGTKDDEGIADYTILPKGLKSRVIDGVRYSSLSHEELNRRKSLGEKEMQFRHDKDRTDLDRMRVNKRFFWSWRK